MRTLQNKSKETNLAKSKEKTEHVIKVIHPDAGEMVQLGGGSYSNLILTKSTLGSNKTMMGYSVFKPGIDTPQKIHLEGEELVYVVSGSGKITANDKLFAFGQGDSIYIPSGVAHGVRNDGMEDVAMVFLFSTPAYPNTKSA